MQNAIDELWALPFVDCVDLDTILTIDDSFDGNRNDEQLFEKSEINSDVSNGAGPLPVQSEDQLSADVIAAQTLSIGSLSPQDVIADTDNGFLDVLDNVALTESTVINDPGSGSDSMWHLSRADVYNAWDIKKLQGAFLLLFWIQVLMPVILIYPQTLIRHVLIMR